MHLSVFNFNGRKSAEFEAEDIMEQAFFDTLAEASGVQSEKALKRNIGNRKISAVRFQCALTKQTSWKSKMQPIM